MVRMSAPIRRSRLVADVSLGVLFSVILACWSIWVARKSGPGSWQFDFCAGILVCAAALLRRRHRAAAAIAGLVVAAAAVLIAWVADLPGEPGPALVAGLIVLVGSAVKELPLRSACFVAAAALAVDAGAVLAVHRSSFALSALTLLVGATLAIAVLVAIGLRWFAARRLASAESVRKEERLELARELHDVVAHYVTGIVVLAQATPLVAEDRPDLVDTAFANIEAAGSDALTAMRRVVGLLRDVEEGPPMVSGRELLTKLVECFDGRGPAVTLRLLEVGSMWPREVTNTIYRVVQESLTNVSRHAPHATSVVVSVVEMRGVVTVEVRDDAQAPVVRHYDRQGFGLVGMRERVEALGGAVSAGPRPEKGWRVLASVPITARSRR